MSNELQILAPAKLNLFLHVVGVRSDGYHLIQSVFQYIDLCDELTLSSREDGAIRRINPIPGLPSEDDLVVRAARLLKQHTGSSFGVDIELVKHIPMGAGLGGGSSDAASLLFGLNDLWNLNLDINELMSLGLRLGADVPFFLYGHNAFVEGIGEVLHAVKPRTASFFLLYPGVSIPTQTIFAAPDLTRNHTPITINDFEEQYVAHHGLLMNDLQSIAIQIYPEVMQAIDWLESEFPGSKPRMSGSGSSVFCEISETTPIETALSKLPTHWQGFKVNSLVNHPAYNLKSCIDAKNVAQKGSRQVG